MNKLTLVLGGALGGAILVVLLVIAGLLIWRPVVQAAPPSPAVSSLSQPVDAPTPEVNPGPTVAPKPVEATIPLERELVTPNFGITVHSAEVTDSIETTGGAPIAAESGTALVLVKSTFRLIGPNAIDLSCGSAGDVFIHAYDSAGGEMAPLFKTAQIPGNQPCNQKIITGQAVEWNFAFKMAAGRAPATLRVIDTNYYGPDKWGAPMILALG